MKHLFEHIIETTEIYELIEQHYQDTEDKKYIVTLVRDTIHHKIVDFILDEVDDEKKHEILTKIDDEKHHKDILDKLRTWIDNFEHTVVKKVKEAEKELMELFEE